MKTLFTNAAIFKRATVCLIILFALCGTQSLVVAAENSSGIASLFTDDDTDAAFLAPDVAFKIALNATNTDEITASFNVAPGHYIYKNRVKFESNEAKIVSVNLPIGEMKNDPTFGQQEVFHHDFIATIKLASNVAKNVAITATYQGCSEKGLCYAPIKKTMNVALPDTASVNTNNKSANDALESNRVTETPTDVNDLDRSTRVLKSGNLWLIIAGFFVAGLLLSLTPCVLPMIPILSSIIVGSQSKQSNPTKKHAFLLSVAYVLGMALSYTLAGVVAGLSGNLISQSLQNPWALSATALVFVLLAFSMFGFYELKLPASFETKMLNTSNRFKGGEFFGVFVMGILSALIVSPCVAAPLAGALLYIGQTHNVFLGGAGLFALAIGMGMPLLLIGASAGKILPKTGNWMGAVRNFFGVLMLAMAVWVVSPVIPVGLQLGLWAAIAIVTAVYLHALDAISSHHNPFAKLWKGIGLLLLVYGIALFIAALSGGQSALQPLSHLIGVSKNMQSLSQVKANKLNFTRIASVDELQAQLENTQGKTVMLDFYADWCVACKELETFTFSDPKVQQLLANTVLLQVDVTKNSAEDQALLKHFGLFGPPGIVFFNEDGREFTSLKTIGFQNAERFSMTLTKRDRCLISPSVDNKAATTC